ncbi:MAG: hypothetical protein M1838_000945 [Thelocarpon superellum]|nr:MAG: hypothetical protein M1838_000945 [Thelocarpon superellum]
MSYPMTQLGGRALNHSHNDRAEEEYDRLRALARQEHGKKSHCLDKSHQAYERGDGAAAHQLSEEGKQHGRLMDQYNRQASEFIFRENNAEGRVASDTIDLHGQFVEEAEQILATRIKAAQAQGQSHLHVIVGKGNHSVDHIQKIKPRVEQLCQELHLQYSTEENAGRMYINLTGGPANVPGPYHPPQNQHQNGGPHQGYGGPAPHQHHHQQQHHQQQQQQQQDPNAEIEQLVKKWLPRILPKIMRKAESCCVVM